MEERFLTGSPSTNGTDCGDGWRDEAISTINDIKCFVNSINICDKLPIDQSGIYFNIETKEGQQLTVELSTAGYSICGEAFDQLNCQSNGHSIQYFETIYALLDCISPGYRESFSSSLAMKLTALLPENTGHASNTMSDEQTQST